VWLFADISAEPFLVCANLWTTGTYSFELAEVADDTTWKSVWLRYNQIKYYDGSTYYVNLWFTTPTATRTIDFPNNSGTVALTSDIPVLPSNPADGTFLYWNWSNYVATSNWDNQIEVYFDTWDLTFSNRNTVTGTWSWMWQWSYECTDNDGIGHSMAMTTTYLQYDNWWDWTWTRLAFNDHTLWTLQTITFPATTWVVALVKTVWTSAMTPTSAWTSGDLSYNSGYLYTCVTSGQRIRHAVETSR
jgi:hypothetical protein